MYSIELDLSCEIQRRLKGQVWDESTNIFSDLFKLKIHLSS